MPIRTIRGQDPAPVFRRAPATHQPACLAAVAISHTNLLKLITGSVRVPVRQLDQAVRAPGCQPRGSEAGIKVEAARSGVSCSRERRRRLPRVLSPGTRRLDAFGHYLQDEKEEDGLQRGQRRCHEDVTGVGRPISDERLQQLCRRRGQPAHQVQPGEDPGASRDLVQPLWRIDRIDGSPRRRPCRAAMGLHRRNRQWLRYRQIRRQEAEALEKETTEGLGTLTRQRAGISLVPE